MANTLTIALFQTLKTSIFILPLYSIVERWSSDSRVLGSYRCKMTVIRYQPILADMNSRQNNSVTRVDVRIPNHLYSQIQTIATEHFNAKIHHRSKKPEITPTILELIQIGIEHFTVSLPVESISNSNDLIARLEELESRMDRVEGTILKSEKPKPEQETTATTAVKSEGISDRDLSNLLGISSTLIVQYRHYGEASAVIKKRLEDWQVVDDLWVRKEG